MKKLSALVAVALFMAPHLGQAATSYCSSTYLKGTWFVVASGINTSSDEPVLMKCTVVIGDNGAITTSGSSCTDSDSNSITFSSGSITISSACALSGTFTTKRGSYSYSNSMSGQASSDLRTLAFSDTVTYSSSTVQKFIATGIKK